MSLPAGDISPSARCPPEAELSLTTSSGSGSEKSTSVSTCSRPPNRHHPSSHEQITQTTQHVHVARATKTGHETGQTRTFDPDRRTKASHQKKATHLVVCSAADAKRESCLTPTRIHVAYYKQGKTSGRIKMILHFRDVKSWEEYNPTKQAVMVQVENNPHRKEGAPYRRRWPEASIKTVHQPRTCVAHV